ncbi:MAG: hypothetical protein ABEJ77_03580 [Halanaeroarchaeum sp.]
MIVRVLLAAIVGAALVATALPVVEDARHDAARAATDRATTRLADAMERLVRSGDPVPLGMSGGRRVLAVDLPPDVVLTIGAGDDALDGPGSDVVTAVVQSTTIGPVRVPVDVRRRGTDGLRPDGAGLAVRGHERLVLRYRTVGGTPTVVVSRGIGP